MEELQRSQVRGDVVCVWLGRGGAVGNNNRDIHGKMGPGCFQGNQMRGRAPTPPTSSALASAWKGPHQREMAEDRGGGADGEVFGWKSGIGLEVG